MCQVLPPKRDGDSYSVLIHCAKLILNRQAGASTPKEAISHWHQGNGPCCHIPKILRSKMFSLIAGPWHLLHVLWGSKRGQVRRKPSTPQNTKAGSSESFSSAVLPALPFLNLTHTILRAAEYLPHHLQSLLISAFSALSATGTFSNNFSDHFHQS